MISLKKYVCLGGGGGEGRGGRCVCVCSTNINPISPYCDSYWIPLLVQSTCKLVLYNSNISSIVRAPTTLF